MNYISFVDLIGTKNLAQYNIESYRDTVVNFQAAMINNVSALNKKGKVHFFSDCAYIESSDLESLLDFIRSFRSELLSLSLYLKGSIIEGTLGAINGDETDEFVGTTYGEMVLARYNSCKGTLKKFKQEINGTLFFSPDIGNAYKFQDFLKGIGIYLDQNLIAKLNNKQKKETVISFFIKDFSKPNLEFFYDIKFGEDELTEEIIDDVIRKYTLSNTYSLKYGRYYLSVLASLINSSDFSRIKFNKDGNGSFLKAPYIFYKILNLKFEKPILYNKALGLEFIYFSLINKLYNDRKSNTDNSVTLQVVKRIVNHNKFINKYLNNLDSIPNRLLSDRNKSYLISDYFESLNNQE